MCIRIEDSLRKTIKVVDASEREIETALASTALRLFRALPQAEDGDVTTVYRIVDHEWESANGMLGTTERIHVNMPAPPSMRRYIPVMHTEAEFHAGHAIVK